MPNIAWTYNTLYAALQAWPVTSSAAYLSNLPTIIGLGERRLWGDLNIEEYDQDDTTSVQCVVGAASTNKPTGALQVRSAGFVPTGGGYTGLEQRSLEYCRNYSAGLAANGPPQYYAEYNQSQIFLSPPPDQTYQMVYHYMGQLPESLSALTQGPTWLSSVGPDALFAACLAEAEQFIKSDDRYADYLTKYNQELLPRLRAEIRKSIRRGDYSPMLPGAAPAQ